MRANQVIREFNPRHVVLKAGDYSHADAMHFMGEVVKSIHRENAVSASREKNYWHFTKIKSLVNNGQ